MVKKRSIISYDSLDIEQKKELLKAFPEGYESHLTKITTPNGESLDAVIWETDEAIFLVKINKPQTKAKIVDEDEDEDEDEDLDKIEDIEAEDDEFSSNDEEEDDEYDKPDDDFDDDSEDED